MMWLLPITFMTLFIVYRVVRFCIHIRRLRNNVIQSLMENERRFREAMRPENMQAFQAGLRQEAFTPNERDFVLTLTPAGNRRRVFSDWDGIDYHIVVHMALIQRSQRLAAARSSEKVYWQKEGF